MKSFFKYLYKLVSKWALATFFFADLLGLVFVYVNNSSQLIKIILTIGLLPCLLIAGYLVYRDDVKDGLRISIKHKSVGHTRVLAIYNGSDFDIKDINVKVFWEQVDDSHDRVLNAFLPANANILNATPTELTDLQKGEKYWAIDCPHHSVDGKIRVEITGENMSSGESVNYTEDVDCPKLDD